jgi:uncharacterized protein (TIGR02996 family)
VANQHTPRLSLESRFWARVSRDGPEHPTLGRCWPWAGALPARLFVATLRDPATGRGAAQHYLPARRVGWELTVGPLPGGAALRQRCGNKACVRPAHLEVVGVAPLEAAFLEAIAADPADPTPRLVYADWLEDHGQAARALAVRRRC